MMLSSRNQISQFFRSTKMRVVLVLLAILACGLALPKYQANEQQENSKQQNVYEVLKYINNPMFHKEFLQVAQSFSLESNVQHFKTDVYQNFLEYFHHDRYLKQGEIFSVFNKEHMQQAKALFELFYYADSYEMFHNTAVWARYHLNRGLFLYSYSVAIAHRPDTQGLVLPPIYELYPHYFFNSEVLQEAYKLKMVHDKNQGPYTVHANYSGFYLNLDPEQSLSYYLEDIGLNAFYFYYNVYNPYWMKSEEFHLGHNRGELFYFVHKQLYARYHLERLSHGLGDIEYFNWDLPFKTGFYPSLTYPNGLPFPERPHFANLKEYLHYYGQRLCDRSDSAFDYTYAQTYERRIRDAIDSGFVQDHDGNKRQLYSEEGMNILGNIIEGNADSPNHQYYGSFLNIARHLLGYSKHPLNHHKLAPSALEHYSTSMRDPAFYHIFKKIFVLIDQFKQSMPHYHQKHLYQNGLKIDNVEIDKLVTYFDHFLSDISNGLYVTPEEYEEDSFRVNVHQYRLNHKNFNYKVHVKADKEMKAAVRVFIGPKYDEHGRSLKLGQIHDKIFQIDYFIRDMKVGDNVITRNSADCYWFTKDYPSFFEGYHNSAEGQQLDVSGNEKVYLQHGLPLRLKLPRGSEDGTSFQVYVIVYPYVPNENVNHQREVDGLYLENYTPLDSFPLGYPFDRPTENEDVYHVPNAFVKHVKIYHQVNKEISQWNDESLEQYIGQDNEDVQVYQRGDHNNYKTYHYQVENDEDKKDSIDQSKNYPATNKLQAYATIRGIFKDFSKKNSEWYHVPNVGTPSYNSYPAFKHQGLTTGQNDDGEYNGYGMHQYSKQNVNGEDKYQKLDTYSDEQNYPKNQKFRAYRDDESHSKYQKYDGAGSLYNSKYQQQYGSDDDQYQRNYLNHGVNVDGLVYTKNQGKYSYGDEQYNGMYQNTAFGNKYGYGRSYGIKYTPYQGADNVKYDSIYHHY